jgi:hypothetical protein
MPTPGELINAFNLQPHPEGGWYRQTYKSPEIILAQALPERFSADRHFSTAIFYLLEKGNFSAFHKIKSDESWHFYDGDPLLIYILLPDGNCEVIKLGKNYSAGERYQYVVPAQTWFASCPAPGSEYCFTGCTVAPGFEFEDFELGDADELIRLYPQHRELITRFCR